MTRHTRSEFNSQTRREALERSNGYCECGLLARAGVAGFQITGCGCPIGIGNVWFEHIIPDYISRDDSLSNCAALTKTCGRLKSAMHDLPTVAKTKRQRDRVFGTKSHSSRPIVGTKRSGWRHKMSGGWERRT